MEVHNNNEICEYVRHRLDIHENVPNHPIGDRKTLANAVADRANGVFLWATLATQEVCSLYRQAETVDELNSFLESLPKELPRYYDHLINEMNEESDDGMIIVKLVASSKKGPLLSDLYHASYLLRSVRCAPRTIRLPTITNNDLQIFAKRLLHKIKGLISLSVTGDKYGPVGLDSDRESSEDNYGLKSEPTEVEADLNSYVQGPVFVHLAHRTLRDYILEHRYSSNSADTCESTCSGTVLWLKVCEVFFATEVQSQRLFTRTNLLDPKVSNKLHQLFQGHRNSSDQLDNFALDAHHVSEAQPLDFLVYLWLPYCIQDYEEALETAAPQRVYSLLIRKSAAMHRSLPRSLSFWLFCRCHQLGNSDQTTIHMLIELTCLHTVEVLLEAAIANHKSAILGFFLHRGYDHTQAAQKLLREAIRVTTIWDSSDNARSKQLAMVSEKIAINKDDDTLIKLFLGGSLNNTATVLRNCVLSGPLALRSSHCPCVIRFQEEEKAITCGPLWILGCGMALCTIATYTEDTRLFSGYSWIGERI